MKNPISVLSNMSTFRGVCQTIGQQQRLEFPPKLAACLAVAANFYSRVNFCGRTQFPPFFQFSWDFKHAIDVNFFFIRNYFNEGIPACAWKTEFGHHTTLLAVLLRHRNFMPPLHCMLYVQLATSFGTDPLFAILYQLVVWWQLWNFIMWQMKFNRFLHPNELPQGFFDIL